MRGGVSMDYQNMINEIDDMQMINEAEVIYQLCDSYSKQASFLEYGIYVEQDADSQNTNNKNDDSLQEKIKRMIQRIIDFFKRLCIKIASFFKNNAFKKKNEKSENLTYSIIKFNDSPKFKKYIAENEPKFITMNPKFLADILYRQLERIETCYTEDNTNSMVYEHDTLYKYKVDDFKIADEFATFNLNKAQETEKAVTEIAKSKQATSDVNIFKDVCGENKMFELCTYNISVDNETLPFPAIIRDSTLAFFPKLVDKLWFVQQKCEKYIRNAKYVERQYSNEKDDKNVSDYCHYMTQYITVLFKHVKFVISTQNSIYNILIFDYSLIPEKFRKKRDGKATRRT